MKVTVVAGRHLSDEHLKLWAAIQESEDSLASPFFRPEFTSLVAATRDDVHVGVVEQGGQVVALFPFERHHLMFGRPVGGALNDLHGVIARAGFSFDPTELIRGCGLMEWQYGRLPVSQASFDRFHTRRHESASMNVSLGWDAYAEDRQREGTRQISKVEVLARKLEMEVGPIRFEAQSRDLGPLDAMMQWKCDRYGELVYPDQLTQAWSRDLLSRIQGTDTPAFAGALSALSVGDELAAVHMGMRSQSVWHYWLPAFNPKFARYSPGLILLLKMAEHAAASGCSRVELGQPDDYLYKRRLMNHSVPLAAGAVASPTGRMLRSLRRMLP
jgi:CelD/BcsL family acetyltransferase involved in cellulose biosynthesis